MRINLDDLFIEEIEPVVLPFAESVESRADVTFPRPVQGEVRLTRAADTVWVGGKVTTSVELTCGRCLRAYDEQLAARFEEGFHPTDAVAVPAGDRRHELADRDFLNVLAGTEIDVTEVVRQHLLMALPIVPVCREDCRGLCSKCGADLNVSACTCAEEAVDPRLAALKGFRSSG